MKKIRIFCLALLMSASSFSSFSQVYVGMDSQQWNYYAASQWNTQWCWAASLQMIFNYYGVSISQDQIVARTYGTTEWGELPNWPGTFEAITANLNNWSIDNNGNGYEVESTLYWGAPDVNYLIDELYNQHPVLIGYQSGPNSGHAVVITACSYYMNEWNMPVVQSIVVRDPWPSQINVLNLGRVEYPAFNLASLMSAHWYIRVAPL